jgi:hypothetical protein
MKKSTKLPLTRKAQKTTLRRMPPKIKALTHQRRLQNRPLQRKGRSFVTRYQKFFISPAPRTWQEDEDIAPFDQPSPLKWVPSETTYGIGA